MGLILNKWCTNKDFHALSTVSDNPSFFDNGKCMDDGRRTVTFKSIESKNGVVKKKKI